MITNLLMIQIMEIFSNIKKIGMNILDRNIITVYCRVIVFISEIMGILPINIPISNIHWYYFKEFTASVSWHEVTRCQALQNLK